MDSEQSHSSYWVLLNEANIILKNANGNQSQSYVRKFKALFGISPQICWRVWSQLQSSLPKNRMPKHLLWASLFSKVYASEHVHCLLTNTTKKTFRKWTWIVINALACENNVRCPFRVLFLFSTTWFVNRIYTNINFSCF